MCKVYYSPLLTQPEEKQLWLEAIQTVTGRTLVLPSVSGPMTLCCREDGDILYTHSEGQEAYNSIKSFYGASEMVLVESSSFDFNMEKFEKL